jgi:pantoate--beta-alanine ligase
LIVLTDPHSMRAWAEQQRLAGERIAFVPTMGALHAGHLRLLELAHLHGDVVVASIFVNPLQFNVRDDFDTYPRPMDDDLAMCDRAGVAAVYAPTAGAMYPEGFQTHVEPGALAEPMEGAMRPGHFRGVTTVVTKLFNAVAPHVALFGQKDFQQLAIIRRMVLDLDAGIEIVSVPTVREHDGLALSSRNRRLSPEQRAAAVVIPQALAAAQSAFRAGERDPAVLRHLVVTILGQDSGRTEYVEVADPETLLPLVTALDGPAVIAVAVWFGDVRLIDNALLEPTVS